MANHYIQECLNMVDEIYDDDINVLIARGSFVSICEIDVLKVTKEYQFL